MKRFAIICGILAVLCGFVFKGSWMHWGIIYLTTLYFGVPLVLFMLGWWGLSWQRTCETPSKLRTLFLCSLLILASMYLSVGIGKAVNARDIRLARAYVENIVPKLDEYHKQHGHYPETLAMLSQESPPTLLAERHSYVTDSSSFRINYKDRSTWGFYRFDSTVREWEWFF